MGSTDESEQEQSADDVTASDKFPAIELTVEEAQRRYDDEEQRRTALESKTSMVIGINALVISLVSSFGQLDIAVRIIVLIPALVSSFIGLRLLGIRDYARPGKDIDQFYQYARQEHDGLLDTLLVSYIETIEENTSKNDRKVTKFQHAYKLSFLSLLLIALTPLLTTVCQWINQAL